MTARVTVHETEFQAHVIAALNAPNRQTRAWRQQAGTIRVVSGARGDRFVHLAPAGAADITGVVRGLGLRLEVEAKSATAPWNEEQQRWARDIKEWGGVYVLVRYDESKSLSENVLDAAAFVDAEIDARRARAGMRS